MFSSPACVVKYMCVRACPLRIDHNAQLARRERPECVGVVRSGAPSHSTFSTIKSFLLFLPLVLPCFQHCLPLSWSHFGMSLHLSAWFVQTLAVPRFLPRQLYKHVETWEEENERQKLSEDFLELQRRRFWTNQKTKMPIFSLSLC